MEIKRPLHDLVVVKPIEVKLKKTSLILPDNIVSRKRFGILIQKSDEVPPYLNIEDQLMWLDEKGEEFEMGEEKYLIMSYKELRAIVNVQASEE